MRRCNHRRSHGFALVLVLALLGMVGVFAVGSLHEALFGQALAGARQLQQRATLLADFGLVHAMRQMSGPVLPADATVELQPVQVAGAAAASPARPNGAAQGRDSVVISWHRLGEGQLPAGFSAGRFVAHVLTIQSTGRAPRGTSVVQTQGVVRVMPVSLPAPVEPSSEQVPAQ